MASLNSSHVGKAHHINPEQEAAIEAISNDISSALSQARKSSVKSLDANRCIGDALIKAKPMLRGTYVKWAKENFDFTKQWCARLTKLALSWSEYEQAKTWAQEQGAMPGNAYSVDGALALTRKWQKATTPEPHLNADEASKVRRRQPPDQRAENDALSAKLAEVSAENDRLKAQLAQLESQIQKHQGAILRDIEWIDIDQSDPAVVREEASDVVSVASTGQVASYDDEAGENTVPRKKPNKGKGFEKKLGELLAMSVTHPFAELKQEIDLSSHSNEELIVEIEEYLREYMSRNALVHFLKWRQSDIRFSVQAYSAENVAASFQLLGSALPRDEIRLYLEDVSKLAELLLSPG